MSSSPLARRSEASLISFTGFAIDFARPIFSSIDAISATTVTITAIIITFKATLQNSQLKLNYSK